MVVTGIALVYVAAVQDDGRGWPVLVGGLGLRVGEVLHAVAPSGGVVVVPAGPYRLVTVLDEAGAQALGAWLGADPDADFYGRRHAADELLDHLVGGEPAVESTDAAQAQSYVRLLAERYGRQGAAS